MKIFGGRRKNPPRSSPGPTLIVVPFGNPTKTRPGRVFRYPHCGCSDAAPATPGLSQKCLKKRNIMESSIWNVDFKTVISYITLRGLLWSMRKNSSLSWHYVSYMPRSKRGKSPPLMLLVILILSANTPLKPNDFSLRSS